jgi:hypothetical protein
MGVAIIGEILIKIFKNFSKKYWQN